MRVFMSVDMEGITGVTGWSQVDRKDPAYAAARRQMAGDVNAAIDGALEAGATEIIVNDSHDLMRNLLLQDLRPQAVLISGSGKPLSMMQGVEGADAAMFIGYHARMGSQGALLDHTMSSSTFFRVLLQGVEVGETEINATIAAHFGIPVVFLSGDGIVCEQAKGFIGPQLRTAAVKTSIGREIAACLHPEVTSSLIREGARDALRNLSEAKTVPVPSPAEISVEFINTGMAEEASICPGAERRDARTLVVRGDTIVEAFYALRTIGALALVPMLLRRI